LSWTKRFARMMMHLSMRWCKFLVIEYLNCVGIFMYDELIEENNNTGVLASAPVLLSRVVKFS
jgi:hypothetical protein